MDLLIDVGSTYIKYKEAGSDNAERVPFPSPIINDGVHFEVDADSIIKVLKTIIDGCNPKNAFISTQMHGYVLLNKGKKVSNYISWRDERANGVKPNFALNADYGVGLKPNLPRLSILKSECKFDTFLTLGSYISFALTGNASSHVTDIAPSGFLNVKNRKFDEVGFNLPSVCYDIEVVGKYKNSNIYCPIGDQQCAIYGVGKYYDLSQCYILNIGTASQLCCVSKEPLSGDFERRPFFKEENLLTVTRLPGNTVISKNEKGLETVLFKAYREAIKKLPKKEKIIITGGTSVKYKELITTVITKLKLPFEFNEGFDGLIGLEILRRKTMNKIGLMLSEIPAQSFPVIMKNSGLDFFIIDYEHGGFDYESIGKLLLISKLCGLETIVRLPNNERKDIIKMLDMGADGLLLPMTNTLKDIEKVVSFAKYPPIGKRGISTMRAHTLYNPKGIVEYVEEANKHVKVYAQIETKEGMKNIDEILSCKDIEGVFVGPNDLSADLGCLCQSNSPEILKAIETIGTKVQKTDKKCGIITGNKNFIALAKENGYSLFSIGSELNAFANYCKEIMNNK